MTSTLCPIEAKNIDSITDIPASWQTAIKAKRRFTPIPTFLTLSTGSISKAALIEAFRFKIRAVAAGMEDDPQVCRVGDNYYFRCKVDDLTCFFSDIGSIGKLRRMLKDLVRGGWIFKRNIPSRDNPRATGYSVNEEKYEGLKKMYDSAEKFLRNYDPRDQNDRKETEPTPNSAPPPEEPAIKAIVEDAPPQESEPRLYSPEWIKKYAKRQRSPVEEELRARIPAHLLRDAEPISDGSAAIKTIAGGEHLGEKATQNGDVAIKTIAETGVLGGESGESVLFDRGAILGEVGVCDQNDRIDFFIGNKKENKEVLFFGENFSSGIGGVSEAVLPLPQVTDVGKGEGTQHHPPSPTERPKPKIKTGQTDLLSREGSNVPPSPAKLPENLSEDLLMGEFTFEERERLYGAGMATWMRLGVEDKRKSHKTDPWMKTQLNVRRDFIDFVKKSHKHSGTGELLYDGPDDKNVIYRIKTDVEFSIGHWIHYCQVVLARWEAEAKGVLDDERRRLTPLPPREIIEVAPMPRDSEGLTIRQRMLIKSIKENRASYKIFCATPEEAIENVKKYGIMAKPGQRPDFSPYGGYTVAGQDFMRDPANAKFFCPPERWTKPEPLPPVHPAILNATREQAMDPYWWRDIELREYLGKYYGGVDSSWLTSC